MTLKRKVSWLHIFPSGLGYFIWNHRTNERTELKTHEFSEAVQLFEKITGRSWYSGSRYRNPTLVIGKADGPVF
jgi:hypothetical protein